MKLFHFIIVLLLGTLAYSCNGKNTIIKHSDKILQFSGRNVFTDSSTKLFWSGASVSIRFTGKTISAKLKDATGKNYYYVIVDDNVINTIHPDTIPNTYTLAEDLSEECHKLTLYKLTEASFGGTDFYYFDLGNEGHPHNSIPHKHKIQFYGNSITSGYSVDDTLGDSKDPKYFNHYYSYGAITARYFNADFQCISKSGIGLMLSWFNIIMPEMYDRIAPEDSLNKWNFKQFEPEIVVVNLLQNDSWLINKPDHPQYIKRFGNNAPDSTSIITAYKNFILTIRQKHPKADIICALGSMDATKEGAPWPRYISQAVNQINDKKVHTLFFPFIGTNTHPKRKNQQAMANLLIETIKNIKNW